MALTMKQRYNLLDLSKLPDNLSSEFKGIKENTDNFDPEMVDIEAENFDTAWGIMEKNHPEAIKGRKSIKKAAPKKTIKPKVKKAVPEKKPIKKAAPKKIIKPKTGKQPDKVAECKKIIQDAGYTVRKSIVKKKKVTKRVKRQDNTIIKEDISKAITTVAKDTVKTSKSRSEYSDSFRVLNSIKKILTNILQGIDKLYNDNETDKLEKIESMLKDIS